MIVSTALLCLALNIYHEARSESIPGQYAVAFVTMNRADSKHEKVCSETFKPKQFSWANNGVYRTKNGWYISSRLRPKEEEAWKRAVIVAYTTLSGRAHDITNGANHYHTTAVRPFWAKAKDRVKKIDSHIFYALN